MEGPFGLASSRCVPRWPWSVFDVSYMSEASNGRGQGRRHRSDGAMVISGMSSTDPPGACSHLEKHNGDGAQQRGIRHRSEDVKVEAQRTFNSQRDILRSQVGSSKTEHDYDGLCRPSPRLNINGEGLRKTYRHVENAVDEAQGENGFGVDQIGPSRSVKYCPAYRSWRCFPVLKQFRQALTGSKDNQESTHVMAYEERLKCRDKWPGGHRSFEIFLLEAPDCPDEVMAQLTEVARRESQDVTQSTLIASRPGDENPSLPSAEQEQHREEMRETQSLASCQSQDKARSPPGKAALRSLTPEGIRRSKSQTPVRRGGGLWAADEISLIRNWIRRNSSSPSLCASTGPRGPVLSRSRPQSPPRQRTPRPRSWSRPASPTLPKGVYDPWGSRDQQGSSRVQSRPQSPNRSIRIVKTTSSSPSPRPSSYPPADECEHERLRTSGPCSIMINERMGISPGSSNYSVMSRPVRDQSRLRKRPSPSPGSLEVHDRLGSPSLGSRNNNNIHRPPIPLQVYDRPGSPSCSSRNNNRPAHAAERMRVSPGRSLALRMATNNKPSSGSAVSSPAGQIGLTDAVPEGTFSSGAQLPGAGGVREATISRQSSVVGTMSTSCPRIFPVRSHIRLVHSATTLNSDSSPVKSPQVRDDFAAPHQRRPLETRVRLPDPSISFYASGSCKPQLRVKQTSGTRKEWST